MILIPEQLETQGKKMVCSKVSSTVCLALTLGQHTFHTIKVLFRGWSKKRKASVGHTTQLRIPQMYKWGYTIFSRQGYVYEFTSTPCAVTAVNSLCVPLTACPTPSSLLQQPLGSRSRSGTQNKWLKSPDSHCAHSQAHLSLSLYSVYIGQQEAQHNQDYTTDHENNNNDIKTFSPGTLASPLWTAHAHWYRAEEVYSYLSAELTFIWLQAAQPRRGWMPGWEVEKPVRQQLAQGSWENSTGHRNQVTGINYKFCCKHLLSLQCLRQLPQKHPSPCKHFAS